MKDAGHADLIRHAVSCSHVWGMTKLHTHCGCCSQCIDRRLAALASGTVEHDPDEMYKTDVFIGQRSETGQDIVLAESYVRSMRECADLTDLQFFSRYGELSRAIPFIDGNSDEAAGKVFDLYIRNGRQVKRAIANALKRHCQVSFVTEMKHSPCLVLCIVRSRPHAGSVHPIEIVRASERGVHPFHAHAAPDRAFSGCCPRCRPFPGTNRRSDSYMDVPAPGLLGSVEYG